MILNYEEVEQKGIFKGSFKGNYNNAVYDISIGKIVTMKGNEVDSYNIPPQGMAVVVSDEVLNMPVDVVGYAHVRTSLSGKGIMAINIGIIDPGYSGNLASTILNFGKEDFSLKVGDRFLRTTFHLLQPVAVNKTAQNKSQDYQHYMINKKFEASQYMDEKFMSFDKEVSKSIKKSLTSIISYASTISVIIAITSLTLASATYLANFIFNRLKNDPTEGYEYQLKINQSRYELLERQYRSLQSKTDSIINTQRQKIPSKIPNSMK